MGHVIVIAEAGVNHNGSIEIAKQLVDKAAEAGADLIKFQTFKSEKLVSRYARQADYQKKNIGKESDDSQLSMLKKLELSEEDHKELMAYCQKKGIKFFSTAFDLESIDYLHSLNLGLWKIPSGEITNYPYIKKIAGYGEPVILSTGMCELSDIKAAYKVLADNGIRKEQITILHCNTEYPTPYEDVNLRAMTALKDEFKVEVGYSDHTKGIEVPIAAVALGAIVIEKHFTLDRNMEGPDHKASLEPDELKAMRKCFEACKSFYKFFIGDIVSSAHIIYKSSVEKVVCVTPPQKDGKILDAILVAADIAGADEIYKVGGAQAIAALAYGTESVPRVEKIVGPGNIFVTAAKKLVYGQVDIEFPAGPSEVLILADKTANPEFLATDILAQAEHDPNASCFLVTDCEDLAIKTDEFVKEMTEAAPRREIIEESLSKSGKIIITDTFEQAIHVTNEYAPEHLIISTFDDDETLSHINNAGSIFLGQYSPVAAGDYGSGTNHVLPTGGGAKMYSGLSTEAFIKKPTVQRLTKDGLRELSKTSVPIAEYEGFFAHANSFKTRLRDE